MPKICYVEKKFSAGSLKIIEQANQIITTYQAQGFNLTLRQLYYQFVSRDLIANKMTEYKRLGSIVSDARRAGLIDWDAIVDRTRSLKSVSHWESPAEIIRVCSEQFKIDKWADQPYHVEVWIEKDALAGVFERVCHQRWDIPYFACRGYGSDSEVWAAGIRLKRVARYVYDGGLRKQPIILHFGDHDPSGVDMTRDIIDRLAMFSGLNIEVRRLALNMDQIEEYNPPPNPAKELDPRATAYVEQFGNESWELDALEPAVLAELVSETIEQLIDQDKWKASEERQDAHIETLSRVSNRWEEVEEFVAD